jgi:hypothetical protein
MCINALKIVNSAAATDYGSSRQRDLGQHWGDLTRGYLAEYAFALYLQKVWGVDAQLDHEQGPIDDYTETDIHQVKFSQDTVFRPTRLNISIKGTKWNGIWLDVPGAQFKKSDVHVLVKVGVGRDHLFAYLKYISVFKDKVLRKGIEIGVLDEGEANVLFNLLPEFQPIPAYICGFAPRDMEYLDLPYVGKKGIKHFTVSKWRGAIRTGDLELIAERENLPKGGNVKFEGIGRFSHDSGYLFNVGSLNWRHEEWQQFVIQKL